MLRLWRRSLLIRMATVTAGAFGLLVLLFGSAMFVVVSTGLHQSLDDNLRGAVQTALPTLVDKSSDWIRKFERNDRSVDKDLRKDLEEHLGAFLSGDVHLQIAQKDGTVVFHSESLRNAVIPEPKHIKFDDPITVRLAPVQDRARAARTLPRSEGLNGLLALIPPGDAYRVVYYSFTPEKSKDALIVAAAAPLRTVADVLRNIARWLLYALVGAWAAVGIGSALLTRSAFRPVRGIIDTVAQIDEASLDVRIDQNVQDASLERLVEVLNGMLTRVESAFRVQRRFVDDASHELRTPLSSLRGELELALRRPRTTDEYREAITRALAEVDHLIELSESLLQIVRSGSGMVLTERIRLHDLAADTLKRCSNLAKDAGVKLGNAVSEDLFVVGDRLALERVFVNLVNNGIQACLPGGQVMLIAERRTVGNRAGAVVIVSDTGEGIPPEKMEHIFDRFYQIRSKENSGKAGLGLAIVREIVAAHQGRLDVESQPAEGTRISVWLPSDP